MGEFADDYLDESLEAYWPLDADRGGYNLPMTKPKKTRRYTKPRRYQKEGANAIERSNGRILMGDEMGLGKSLQALLWAKRNPEIRPIIIVCPASLKYNWEREASKHFGMYSEVLEGRTPDDIGLLGKTYPIFIINYDILHWWVPYLRKIRPKLIILDEVHFISNRRTKRAKAARELCKRVKHIICLSGTPFTNRPSELWNVLNLINPKEFPTFREFAEEYCNPKWTRFGWDFSGAKNLPLLHKRLKRTGTMIRRLKSEVLKDLPPKTHSIVPMEIKGKKQYRMASQDFVAWAKKYQVKTKAWRSVKVMAKTRVGHLKRLAARLKMRSVIQWIDNYLAESDGKLIVFAIHKIIIKELRERYAHQCVVIDGSVTGRKRQLAVDQFQKNKRIRLIFANTKAGGVGLNMTAANNVAVIEFPWTKAELDQCTDRSHRLGQKKKVNCYYLVAHGTIEEKIIELLQRKGKNFHETFDGKSSVEDEPDLMDLLLEELTKGKRK